LETKKTPSLTENEDTTLVIHGLNALHQKSVDDLERKISMNDKMKYNLFLDDYRNPSDAYFKESPLYKELEWVIVRNYEDFISYIKKNGVPAAISFDHDLGFDLFLEKDYEDYDPENEKTGLDCARWLLNYCLDNNLEVTRKVYIHTNNAGGALNIKSEFETFDKVHGDGPPYNDYPSLDIDPPELFQ